MRRLFTLTIVPAALVAASLGCKSGATTGNCDCGEYPGQGVYHSPIQQHPITPSPSYEPVPAPKGAQPLPSGPGGSSPSGF